MIKIISPKLKADKLKVGIISARFNSFVVDHLTKGAEESLERHGVKNIISLKVPGSYEIPYACKWMIENEKVDGIVALGAIIRGATDHYDLVCKACSDGIMRVQLESGIPIGFGVITTDTIEQAIERSGCKAGNKGIDAAEAMLEMALLG